MPNSFMFSHYNKPSLINKLIEVLQIDIDKCSINGSYLIIKDLEKSKITNALESLNKAPDSEIRVFETTLDSNRNVLSILSKTLYNLYPTSEVKIINYEHDLTSNKVKVKYTIKTRGAMDELLFSSLSNGIAFNSFERNVYLKMV